MKKVIINQFRFLGDIIFIEPIFRYFHNHGYQVIVPVDTEYLWLQAYIPYVEFIDKNQYPYNYEGIEQVADGNIHIPMRFAHPLYRGYDDLHYGDDRKNWMRDKYLFLGFDEFFWRTIQWKRNQKVEYSLYYKVIGINNIDIVDGFNLVNQYFGGTHEKVEIIPDNDLPTIYMSKVDDYTLLDWAIVIELATNIYIVDSSIVWLIEVLQTKAEQLHIYPRLPFLPNVDHLNGYLTKDWIKHNKD